MSHNRILVVEDDRPLARLYRMELELRGFTVETASDGLEALELVEAGPTPNLVVLDLDLPRLSGQEVAKELAAHEKTRMVPTIVVTGIAGPVDESLFTEVIRKPIPPSELAYKVSERLSRGPNIRPSGRSRA